MRRVIWMFGVAAAAAYVAAASRTEPASEEIGVDPIAATSTKAGLKVRAQIDSNRYPAGLKISEQVATLNLERDDFHASARHQLNQLVCDRP